MAGAVARISKALGKPRNYGPTPDEQAEMSRKAEEAVERKRRQDDWAERLELVRAQEHEMLELMAAPMRNYLMACVMPKLTEGLMDCGKVRPEDPVDYLVRCHSRATVLAKRKRIT